MASRSVVFPEPLGPMIPVSPVSNSTYVSACCRKFRRRRLFRRTRLPSLPRPVYGAGRGRRRLHSLGLLEVVQAEGDERLAVDVALKGAGAQLVAHGVGERRASPGAAAGAHAED